MKPVINILNEDCISGLKKIEDNSYQLCITSPPYYNARLYSTWASYDLYLDFLKETFEEVYRILESGRMCCVNISVIIEPRVKRSQESRRIAIPFHFVNLMETIGFKFLEDIIWIKPSGASKNRNGGFYRHRQPVAYKPNIVNEYIFIFQKPMDGLIDKIVRSYSGKVKELSLVSDGYEMTNVWKMNPETKSEHSAAFPLELSNKLITYYSYVGDSVIDPFLGSGTTAISAYNLMRNCTGFEIHKEYCDIANKRMQDAIMEVTE